MKLTGTLSPVGQISGEIRAHPRVTGIIYHTDKTPYYRGNYEVKPSAESQTLYTQGLRMTDDVTIQEIPYYETTNESGGYTVIIGE